MNTIQDDLPDVDLDAEGVAEAVSRVAEELNRLLTAAARRGLLAIIDVRSDMRIGDRFERKLVTIKIMKQLP